MQIKLCAPDLTGFKRMARLIAWAVILASVLTGCRPEALPTAEPNLLGNAELQATALIRQAEATALLIKAGAQATALVQNASLPVQPGALETLDPVSTPVPTQFEFPALTEAAPAVEVVATAELDQVRIVNVSYAGEGSYIIVQFMAPQKITRNWTQTNVSVTDEASGTVYNEVPVVPIVGPLFARPLHAEQIGYVMLVNLPNPLPPGSLVTVILGDFKQEHLTIQ
jgi:hypothetical protein